MRRSYTNIISWIIVIAIAVSMNFGFAYASLQIKDTTYLHYKKTLAKQSYLKNGLSFALPPLKPGIISKTKVSIARPDDKLLNDVEVSPNPATDQLTFKYSLSHNSNVTIKIMDVLGNDVLTVLQQRVDLGEQKFTYTISNKLSRGFYFVRINAGTESVIKRISVL